MPDRRELELRLNSPGYMSRIVVDGVELSNIQSAVVRSDATGLTTVEVVYIALHQPFVLRGQMQVVYDGPADEAPPAPRLVNCKGCNKRMEENDATQINPAKPWQPFPLVGDWWCLDCTVAHKHEGAKP